jgi:ABC-type glutathione transport system ATPase component
VWHRVLAGLLTPTRGTREQFHGARVAYFGQYREFDPRSTPLQIMHEQCVGANDDDLRKQVCRAQIVCDVVTSLGVCVCARVCVCVCVQLGSMGLAQLATHAVGTLSGGQKQRLGLAIVAQCEPHVLLLDEPTQHLDYKSIESLVLALNEFQGAIVCVTHDEWFCAALQCDTIWRAKDGQVRVVTEM